MLFLYAVESARYGFGQTLVKPIWLFSLYYLLSYPVKYIIIKEGYPIQAPTTPDMYLMDYALIISFLFWIFTSSLYFIYTQKSKSLKKRELNLSNLNNFPQNNKIFNSMVLIMILISAQYYYTMLSSNSFQLINYYVGNEQNEARVGAGLQFMASGLYIIGYAMYLFAKEPKKGAIFYIFTISVLIIAFFASILLTTRRPLFLIIYMWLIFFYISKKNNSALFALAIFPIISILLAPIAQIFRYSFSEFIGLGKLSIEFEYVIVSIGSTFEGIEYLTRYLEVVNTKQFLLGVDQGIVYAFNTLFSLIPRSVWLSKPETHGTVEIQNFLYGTGFASTTLPSGIVVDALYGFGMIGFILYAALTAYILKIIERILFTRNTVHFSMKLALSVYAYVYMFNILRSGTGVIQSIIVLSVIIIISVKFNKIRFLKI